MTVYEAFRMNYAAKAARAKREPRVNVLAATLGMILGMVARFRREILTVAGLVLLASAAWTYSLWAGLAATGAACFVLENLMDE